MRILLDTNAYSEMKRGQHGVADLVRAAHEVVMSTVVVGELLFGFALGSRSGPNRKELRAFLAAEQVSLVPVTLVTAERFGLVAAALRKKGRPIPTNDVWIAAHALETGADLVSFDEHFAEIDGLAWVKPN